MKSIKKKILMPFIIILVLIPLLTIILFNISMRIYVTNTAKTELNNTLTIMNNLVRKGIAENRMTENESSIANMMGDLRKAVQVSKLTNIDVLLINRNGVLAYPKDFTNQELLDKVLSGYKTDEKITTVRTKSGSYLILSHKVTKLNKSSYIVFISSLNSANDFIRIINLILIAIMLTGAAVSVFAADRLTNNISRQVKNLSHAANEIGEGRFEHIANDTDITEIAELNRSINSMSDKIKAYDEAQKAFLQNVSHELRTPLMSIGGYAEGIENGVLPDVRKSAGIIKTESNRLNRLVDDLLTLSRIENKTYEKALADMNLSEMLKEYVQRLSGFALKEGKKLELSIGGDNISVLANDTLLSQAITNVVGNCIRYAKDTVNIRLTQDSGRAVIRISDDGGGIDEKDLPHIFDRFYKGKSGNMGLGLAIAKSAVQCMGGIITAYNDGGAVFEIRL